MKPLTLEQLLKGHVGMPVIYKYNKTYRGF